MPSINTLKAQVWSLKLLQRSRPFYGKSFQKLFLSLIGFYQGLIKIGTFKLPKAALRLLLGVRSQTFIISLK
ncbi:unnamed protein product [Brassica rapa subsp. trilocularis]